MRLADKLKRLGFDDAFIDGLEPSLCDLDADSVCGEMCARSATFGMAFYNTVEPDDQSRVLAIVRDTMRVIYFG